MIRFRKLNPRYLDLELSTAGGIDLRVVERPGLWMRSHEIEKMVGELRAVVAAVLDGHGLRYGVFGGDRRTLERSVITLLREQKTGRVVAFNVLSLLQVPLRRRQVDVIHLGLAMVHPEFRGQGFSAVLYGLTCLLLFVRNQLRPIWVSNVSQVPSVIGLVAETLSDVFPSADPARRRSYDHLVIAREIMTRHRGAFGVGEEAGFDEDRFVITNAYTNGSESLKKSLAAAPRHRNDAYNQMCARELRYDVGDDFLQIGRMDLPGARNFLFRNVPRAWLPSLWAPLATIFLETSLLPVIHWLTPSKPMGDLRPWQA